MKAWWWDTAVVRRPDMDTVFMLPQSPDAVEVGHLLAWWPRPVHTVFVTTVVAVNKAAFPKKPRPDVPPAVLRAAP